MWSAGSPHSEYCRVGALAEDQVGVRSRLSSAAAAWPSVSVQRQRDDPVGDDLLGADPDVDLELLETIVIDVV